MERQRLHRTLEMETRKEEILFAEDSKAQSDILKGILAEGGYAVRAVENGLEGLYELTRKRPDLIISDVWMPKMNGYEFCQAVKGDKNLKSIPVILLTSLSELKDIVKGLEAGADYYLTKPYDGKLLLLTIEKLLSRRLITHAEPGRKTKAVVEIEMEKELHQMTVEPQQIVNFLLSTYQNMLLQNKNLEQTRLELRRLNAHLEERVREKTRVLEEEILERKKAEEALLQSEKKYRSIFENAMEGIFQFSPEGIFLSINPAFSRMFGYESPEQMTRAANNGSHGKIVGADSLAGFSRMIADRGSIRHLETKAWRADGVEICIDMSARAVRDESGGILYYEGNAEDVTERKKASEALEVSCHNLRRTLDGTVKALATTIEMRDPYTAGHQRRVAQLACAIGRQLGWDEERLEGLEVTGFLHDIGKIVVPAEILAKPGELNELEYNMIKAHPQVGYNILKGIEFPWPVNLAVLQHHERLDGSGYPKGLRAEELVPEAKILAVADVVESMASHRPYRPALGIQTALSEVSGRRGILYDNSVVDACIELFETGDFVLG